MEEDTEKLVENQQQSPPFNKQQQMLQNIDASELIEKLLSNEHIPEYIKIKWWVLFSRSTKLTFLRDSDVEKAMTYFELLKINTIEEIPKLEYNEEMEDLLLSLEMEYFFNINRSRGLRMNERELISVQTTANFSERPTTATETSSNKGFLSKLFNLGR